MKEVKANKEDSLRKRHLHLVVQSKNRKELLSHDPEAIIRARKLQQQQDALKSAEAITESLKRTKSLLEQQLERSGKTLEKLVESNQVIVKTMEETKNYKDETLQAKNERLKLKQQERKDFIIIACAWVLYILVIIWILIARYSFLLTWMF